MRNQTSFRLTTTLLPTGLTAKTTQVINKVDENGEKFYPNFTEETVVITNDDRTIIETTRATCVDGLLTFTKRGMSDDASGTQIENRKLTWNPGSLCFVTAGASDWIDKDDDIVWTGKQTYTGDMESKGSANYKGLLITEKGVKYPSFANLEALQAYLNPFGGMFATLDSTGELYRYNEVTGEWSVVTTAEPTNPEMADEETIGTVRIATDEEFENGISTGAKGEKLVATPEQIKSSTTSGELKVAAINQLITVQGNSGESASTTYTAEKSGFISYRWAEHLYQGKVNNYISISSANGLETQGSYFDDGTTVSNITCTIYHEELLPVTAGETVTFTLHVANGNFSPSTSGGSSCKLLKFFYFG